MRASEVSRLLSELGVTPDRRLGQSFLVNDRLAARMAGECSGPTLEIGPGLGALTVRLLETCESVTAVEISERLAGHLGRTLSARGLVVVRGDFLRTDPRLLPGSPFTCVASNLPYSISSPSVMRLVEPAFSQVRRAVVMLQAEVAERIAASPGGKAYGRLTLGLWPHFTPRPLLEAEPGDFHPEPAVRSRVLVLDRRDAPLVPAELLPQFRRVVAAGFSKRRKTILNNLSDLVGRPGAGAVLRDAGIDSTERAERIPPEGFVRIAELTVR